jgi:hypothetical protein
VQLAAIDYLFKPLVLQRIDDNPLISTVPTMQMSDLFDWLHDGIFTNLRAYSVPLISRNLQMGYVQRLSILAWSAPAGTPSDAQALAQAELLRIARDAASAMSAKHDAVTQAHLAAIVRAAKPKPPS